MYDNKGHHLAGESNLRLSRLDTYARLNYGVRL
jgi:hypothetical protein